MIPMASAASTASKEARRPLWRSGTRKSIALEALDGHEDRRPVRRCPLGTVTARLVPSDERLVRLDGSLAPRVGARHRPAKPAGEGEGVPVARAEGPRRREGGHTGPHADHVPGDAPSPLGGSVRAPHRRTGGEGEVPPTERAPPGGLGTAACGRLPAENPDEPRPASHGDEVPASVVLGGGPPGEPELALRVRSASDGVAPEIRPSPCHGRIRWELQPAVRVPPVRWSCPSARPSERRGLQACESQCRSRSSCPSWRRTWRSRGCRVGRGRRW